MIRLWENADTEPRVCASPERDAYFFSNCGPAREGSGRQAPQSGNEAPDLAPSFFPTRSGTRFLRIMNGVLRSEEQISG